MTTVLGRRIRQALALQDEGLTDAELLARFVAGRDEASFAALVRRHGPMVLGVCRRLVRGTHDCEDCFQAVFLVLACKAAAVAVKGGSLACWLHAVAHRCALSARGAAARRRAREAPMDGVEPAVGPPEPRDWVVVLDEELGKLAEKYRSVLLLCDLQGRTRKEAARLLGVPPGTVDSRLATARQALAVRLARRGVTLPAGVALTAAVPAALTGSTARAAALAAAGEAVAASAAATLMQEVLKAMFVKKLCKAVVVVLAALALGGGLAYRGVGPGSAQAAPPEAKPLSELEALRRENEVLRRSLRLALDRVDALEARVGELQAAAAKERENARLARFWDTFTNEDGRVQDTELLNLWLQRARPTTEPEAEQAQKAVEEALKSLRSAKDEKGRREALGALEAAVKRLVQTQPPQKPPAKP
jgi:RNA polymerase sigma factor (sigma-70 family)